MNFIEKHIFYGLNNLSKENNIHIAYGIDNNFIRAMGISITSIILNNIKEKIVFHIISSSDIEDKNLKYIEKISEQYNITIHVYIISSCFKSLPKTSYISRATYNRLLIPLILKDKTDKVLYLDADVICLSSLEKLIKLDFDEYVTMVVMESNDVVVKGQISELGLKNNRYFNAGVLYINIEKWLKLKINDKILKEINKHKSLKFMDQDLLNIILENHCKYIDKIYNYTFDIMYKENKYIYDIPDNVVFLHYVGKFKPWQEWCMHPLREKFRNISQQSLWKDISWDKPKTYKDMKKMGKSYLIYGHRLKALYWYLKYSIYKIRDKLKFM